MNLRAYRTVTAGASPGWSGIDAGRRAQIGSPVTGIRHFRVGVRDVKRGGAGPGTRNLNAGTIPLVAAIQRLAEFVRPLIANRKHTTAGLIS